MVAAVAATAPAVTRNHGRVRRIGVTFVRARMRSRAGAGWTSATASSRRARSLADSARSGSVIVELQKGAEGCGAAGGVALDGAPADAEGIGDAGLVEVEVVAEHEDLPLAGRESLQRVEDGGAPRAAYDRFVRTRARGRGPALLRGG